MSGKIIGFQHENERHDNRRPLHETWFVIGGEAFEVVDVSMGGFFITGAPGKFRIGQEVVVSEIRVAKEPAVKFGVGAEAVRGGPKGTGSVGFHFHGLSAKQFDLVEALVMHRPLTPKKKSAPKKKKGLFDF